MPLDFKFGLTWVYGEKKGSFTMFHRPFLEAIKDWGPAFEEIAADVLEPHVKAAFDTEGSSEKAPTGKTSRRPRSSAVAARTRFSR